MKKLVIINFDDMFVNVSKIICEVLNSLKQVNEKCINIDEYHIGYDLEKPFPQLFYEVLEDFDITIETKDLEILEERFERQLIKRAVLANGLQEFLLECKDRSIEVIVITNKPYKAIYDCVKYYTFDLVNQVLPYDEPYEGIHLIERLQKERKLHFDDLLIVSATDFNDEYLEPYEYSREYCGRKVFNDYNDLICVLDGEELELPSISLSLDIDVDKENFYMVYNIVKELTTNIDVIECSNEKTNNICLNSIETECYEGDVDSMMIENIIEKCISPFYSKGELIKKIQKEFNCKFTLCCAIYLDETKVNPAITPTLKIMKFLAENNIELDYAIYC